MSDFANSSGHWYALDGAPAYTIVGRNGKERPTTLRDAREHNLVPSVTGIIRCASAPQLEKWNLKLNMVIPLPGHVEELRETADRLTPKQIVAELDKHIVGQHAAKRAVVELAKDWRLDKYLRQLQALLIVANEEKSYLISGTGDLISPDDGLLAIGSGGPYALAAARALVEHTDLSAAEIAREGLRIASTICIYTNDHITVEEL